MHIRVNTKVRSTNPSNVTFCRLILSTRNKVSLFHSDYLYSAIFKTPFQRESFPVHPCQQRTVSAALRLQDITVIAIILDNYYVVKIETIDRQYTL